MPDKKNDFPIKFIIVKTCRTWFDHDMEVVFNCCTVLTLIWPWSKPGLFPANDNQWYGNDHYIVVTWTFHCHDILCLKNMDILMLDMVKTCHHWYGSGHKHREPVIIDMAVVIHTGNQDMYKCIDMQQIRHMTILLWV